MTGEELAQRIEKTKKEVHLAYFRCDNNRDESKVLWLNKSYWFAKEKLEAEQALLTKLQEE